MISPRRILAIGLAVFVTGTLTYFVGTVAVVLAAQRDMFGGKTFSEDDIPTMVRAIASAAEIQQILALVGGSLALLGVIVSTVGAVCWLWADGSHAPDRPTLSRLSQ
jgi:hypothetical protein